MKAQSSIEFIVLVSAALFFVTLLLFAIGSNTSDKIRENQNKALRGVADSVNSELELAYYAGDGYSRNFTVPNVILSGVEYDITLDGTLLYLNTTDGRNSLAIGVPNVTGSINLGNNQIRNVDGEVYLNSP